MSTLFIICAPSGAGKTSLVASLINNLKNLEISISHTTRPKRPEEKNGVNYHFVDIPTFKRMIAVNDFFEYATVFGHYYGTSKRFVEEKLAKNIDVILEIDWQGAQQIKKLFKNATSIFILPPSMEVLEKRLRQRNQDAAAVIERRLTEARNEIHHYDEFDYLVVNDDFNQALCELQSIITARRLSLPIQKQHLKDLIRCLLKENDRDV